MHQARNITAVLYTASMLGCQLDRRLNPGIEREHLGDPGMA